VELLPSGEPDPVGDDEWIVRLPPPDLTDEVGAVG
jgi:hypothetical protein